MIIDVGIVTAGVAALNLVLTVGRERHEPGVLITA